MATGASQASALRGADSEWESCVLSVSHSRLRSQHLAISRCVSWSELGAWRYLRKLSSVSELHFPSDVCRAASELLAEIYCLELATKSSRVKLPPDIAESCRHRDDDNDDDDDDEKVVPKGVVDQSRGEISSNLVSSRRDPLQLSRKPSCVYERKKYAA